MWIVWKVLWVKKKSQKVIVESNKMMWKIRKRKKKENRKEVKERVIEKNEEGGVGTNMEWESNMDEKKKGRSSNIIMKNTWKESKNCNYPIK